MQLFFKEASFGFQDIFRFKIATELFLSNYVSKIDRKRH